MNPQLRLRQTADGTLMSPKERVCSQLTVCNMLNLLLCLSLASLVILSFFYFQMQLDTLHAQMDHVMSNDTECILCDGRQIGLQLEKMQLDATIMKRDMMKLQHGMSTATKEIALIWDYLKNKTALQPTPK